jgi:hypothetical protein
MWHLPILEPDLTARVLCLLCGAAEMVSVPQRSIGHTLREALGNDISEPLERLVVTGPAGDLEGAFVVTKSGFHFDLHGVVALLNICAYWTKRTKFSTTKTDSSTKFNSPRYKIDSSTPS